MARLTRVRPLEELEERIGVRIPDRGRLERALTHSSFRSDKGKGRSYERLEFLGDRVLNLLAAERLMSLDGEAREGEEDEEQNRREAEDAVDLREHLEGRAVDRGEEQT